MSKWRTLRSDKVDMEFSDYYKMRNSAEPIGPSSSTFVVGSKTKINKNGMDESSPSYNRIVRPIMVMPQEPNSDQIKQWKSQMTKNGDLYQNAGGWLWDNLAAGAGYTMASYEDYVSWSKDNGSKNDPELLKGIKNAKKGVVLTDKNFSPPCVFWENITTRTTSPYSAMFRAKQMMFERTVYKGGKGVFSIVCPDTQSLNFWVTVCIYDGGFPTKIPTSADQASNSFTLSPSNPRQVVELPRAVKKNITSLYCAGEKNLIEDTKSGFDSNYDYLTVICIVTFAEPNEKYIGKNIGQLVFEFEAEGDGATENKAVTNYSLWQINGFNSSASGSVDPGPTPGFRQKAPGAISMSSPAGTMTKHAGKLVTTKDKDTVLWSEKFQMGYTLPHSIPILKDMNKKYILSQLRKQNSSMLNAMATNDLDIFFGVNKEQYLASLSAKALHDFLHSKYGPLKPGDKMKTINSTEFSVSGFNIKNSFDLKEDIAKGNIDVIDAPVDGLPTSLLDEKPLSLGLCPKAYTPDMKPHTFHFTPDIKEGDVYIYKAPEFVMDKSTSYTISVPFLNMRSHNSTTSFANRAYTQFAPEITLHTTTFITNPLADEKTSPLTAGWDMQINYNSSEFAVDEIKTDPVTLGEDDVKDDLQMSNIRIDVPEGLQSMPDLKQQYIAAKKEAAAANLFNLNQFFLGVGKCVKGVLNTFIPGEQPKNASFLSKICRAQNKGVNSSSNAGETSYIGEDENGFSYVIAGGMRAVMAKGDDDSSNFYLKKFYKDFPCSGYTIDYSNLKDRYENAVFVKVSAKLQINPGLFFSVSNPYYIDEDRERHDKKVLSMLWTKGTTEGVLKQPVSRSLIIPVLMCSRYPPNNPNCLACAVPLTNPSTDYSTVSNSLPPITSYNTYDFGTTPDCGDTKKMLTRGLNVSFNYDSVVELDCSFYIPDQLPVVGGDLQPLADGEKMYVFLALAQSYTLAWGNQPLQADLEELATIDLHTYANDQGKYVWTNTDWIPKFKSAAVFVTVGCDNSVVGGIEGDVMRKENEKILWYEPNVVKINQDKSTMASGFHLISSSFNTEVTAPLVQDIKEEEV